MRALLLKGFVFIALLLCSFWADAQCWKRQFPSTSTETPHQMIFTTPSDGIVVGDGGNILRTADSGNSWMNLEVPTFNDLFTVAFPTPQKGWAAGARGTVLKTNTGGFTWVAQSFSDSINIRSITFKNTDTGYLCGDSCLYATYNGGSSWVKASVTPVAGSNFSFVKAFSGSNTVIAYRNGQLSRSLNNGATWTVLSSNNNFSKVDFATPAIGFAIRLSANAIDQYCKTVDGGLTWTVVYTPGQTTASYYPYGGIQCLDSNRVFILISASSTGSQIIYTADGGQTWMQPYVIQLTYTNCLYFTSVSKGCVGNIMGQLYRTTNASVSHYWVNEPPTVAVTGVRPSFAAIDFADSLHGIATGSRETVYTKNGGTTWLAGGSLQSNNVAWKAHMSDSVTGWIIDEDRVLFRTLNGGQTYTIAAYNCNDIHFWSRNFGIRAHNNAMWRTTNAGSTWTNVMTAITNFTAVDCLDSLNWYAIGGFNSVYKSTDGGITWNGVPGSNIDQGSTGFKAFPNGRLYNSKNHLVIKSSNEGISWDTTTAAYPFLYGPEIDFADSLHGIATAAIGSGGLWGNPVVLHTSNGAQSWNPLPIHSGSAINGVAYLDTGRIWACTNWGSIFRHYNTCPPVPPQQPAANRSYIISCISAAQTVTIANYSLYTTSDTVSAVLRQYTPTGTIVQTLSINAQGQINFTAPNNYNLHYLEINVRNAAYPTGISKLIPVNIQIAATPFPGFSYGLPANMTCAPVSISLTNYGAPNYGNEYVLELHQLRKNGTDTVLGTGLGTKNLTGLMDTCQLYYKLIVGNDLCFNQPVYYSDTLRLYIAQPKLPVAHIISLTAATVFCQNDSVLLKVQAPLAKPGSIFKFYSLAGSVSTLLQTSTDSLFSIPALLATTKIYATVQASANSCVTVSNFASDTLTITVAPPAGLTVTLTTNKPQNTVCTGDSLVFNANANLPASTKQFEFHAVNLTGVDAVVQSGLDSQYATVATASQRVYVVAHIPAVPCSGAISDTVQSVVNAIPVQPVITVSGTVLSATPFLPGGAYQWYLAGILLPGTTDTLHVSAAGNYTVKYSLLGCYAPLSLPFNYVPSGLEKAPFSNSIRVYPNPVTATLWVEGSAAVVRIVISTLEGKMLSEQKPEAGTRKMLVSMQGLPGGTYLLHVMGPAGESYRQLVTKVAE